MPHTPGPWEADLWTDEEMQERQIVAELPCGRAILAQTTVAESDVPDDESAANASVMAAAPELLEACIQTERVMSGGPMTLAEAQTLLRAAIAKALGPDAPRANARPEQPAASAEESHSEKESGSSDV